MPIERERVSSTGWFPPWVRYEHRARYAFSASRAEGKVVIDCACGDGSCARLLAEKATEVYAFDLSKLAIANARQLANGRNLQFAVANASALPVPGDYADLYVSLETIEHVPADAAFLQEVVRVLKSDGVFICSTPDRDVYSPGNQITSRPWNRFHFREYSQREFVALLHRYFRHVELFGQNPKWPLVVELKAWLGRWLPGYTVVRMNQALKLARALLDRFELHFVARVERDRRYEALVAVCSSPHKPCPAEISATPQPSKRIDMCRIAPMRIALIYDGIYPYVGGGAERRTHAIAANLGANHHATLYGLHYWRKDPGWLLANATYVAVAPGVPQYTKSGRRSLLEPFVFAFGLFWALLRSREEVWDVASFPYVSVPVARLMSILKRRTLLVTWLEYWGDYWYEYLGPLGMVGKLFEALALRCSHKIIAISEFTKRRLVAAGAAEHRIVVVPSGVDTVRIAAAPKSIEQADLVFAGRLVATKQVRLLIEAMSHLLEQRPGATLLVIGDGPERRRLQDLVARLELGASVRFAGLLPSAEDVYAHLKSSRVLVLPSKREGFGTVVLEAWACGIPVVVCDESENAAVELVDSPAKGRIVSSDPRAIAAACAELLSTPTNDRRRVLQAAAAQYDWSSIAAKVLEVYSASHRGDSRGGW